MAREDRAFDEQAWADLVAAYHAAEEPVGRWPADEDIDEAAEESAGPTGGENVTEQAQDPTAMAARGSSVPPEDHFVPPTPPPLPRGDALSRVAWAGVLGGPAYLLLVALTGGVFRGWAAALALAAFVGGFVTLVVRMGGRSEDDPDDGAVV